MDYDRIDYGGSDPKSNQTGTFQSSLFNRIGTTVIIAGACIGCGNVWRFPEQVAKHGGLAFLLIYVCAGILYACPLVVMETFSGQMSRGSQFDGALLTGNKKYIFSGLSMIGGIGVFFIYLPLMAWSGHYLINSFKQPWYPPSSDFDFCSDYLDKAACMPVDTGVPCPSTSYCVCSWSEVKRSCVPDMFGYAAGYFNEVTIPNTTFGSPSPPSAGWSGYIENHNWGTYSVHVVNMTITILAVSFGDTVLRYLCYIMAVPVLTLMLCLFGYSLSVSGAKDGLVPFVGSFRPNNLIDVEAYRSAVTQVVFSVSIGSGAIPALSSMNKQADPIGTSAWWIVSSDTFFGCLSGFIVFSMLGYLAGETGQPVTTDGGGGLLGSGGAGLIYITYSSGLSHLTDGSTTGGWLHLAFWFMFYYLGMSGLIAIMKFNVIVALENKSIKKMFSGYKRPDLTAKIVIQTGVYVLLLLAGFITCSDYGVFMIDAIDHYNSYITLPFGTASLGLCYTWLFNEGWYVRNYGRKLRVAQNMFFIGCIFVVAYSRLSLGTGRAPDIIWLCCSLIFPLIQPFLSAIYLKKRNSISYMAALDLTWNGAFGDVLDNFKEFINYQGPMSCGGGGTFRAMAGMIRNMSTPLLLGLIADSLCTKGYFIGWSPGAQPMPWWMGYLTFGMPMLLFLGVFVSLVAPEFMDGLLTANGEGTRGLLLNDEPCWGLVGKGGQSKDYLKAEAEAEGTSEL